MPRLARDAALGHEDEPAPVQVLLTGAAGFLGSHVARALLARGIRTTAVVRPGGDPWRIADLRGRLSLVGADLNDAAALERVLVDAAPQVVCDLAWEGVGNRFHDQPRQVGANLSAHLALIAAA